MSGFSRTLFKPVDAGDVRVVEGGEHFSFALESRQAISVARDRGGQHLDRHRALQVRVGGAIHLAHAPFADLGGDFIGAEPGAGGERHARAV